MVVANDRILVVKLADLGDLLLCEPAFRSLRNAYPDARIDVLVPPSSAGLVSLLGHDLRTVTFPKYAFDRLQQIVLPRNAMRALTLARQLRLAHYDMVVLLHHLTTRSGALKFRALAAATGSRTLVGLDNGRGAFLTERVIDLGFGSLHEAEYMLAVARAAGGADVDAAPRIATPIATTATSFPTPYAVLYPVTGGYSSARTWPVERFVTIARALCERGIVPVIVGASDATEAAQQIISLVPHAQDASGRTSLDELRAIIANASIVVGGDSFVGHLAAALDRPQVAIFGPSNVDAWRPYGSVENGTGASRGVSRRVVRYRLPCEPCLYTGYRLGRPDGCPTRTCMARASESMVMQAIDDILKAA
jgi:ADP-heptose:LPS heptosyltransferase